MIIKINQLCALFILFGFGLSVTSASEGERIKRKVSALKLDKYVKKLPASTIRLKGLEVVEDKSLPFNYVGVRYSDREDGCFWTKIMANRKGCDPLLTPAVMSQYGENIINLVEAIDCAHVSILQSVSKACNCAEKRVDVLDTESDRETKLKEVSEIEQDTFRRVELEKNLEKIIIREYLFTEKLPSCNVSKRFKKIMDFSQKRNINYLTEEKRKFCSTTYDPTSEIDLFKNLQNGGIPLLNFEETIKAGADLVSIVMKKILSDDIIRLNKLSVEDPKAYNVEIQLKLIDVRKTISEYLESEDNQHAEKFVAVNCSKDTIKKNGYSDLCSVLKKMNSYSSLQKKSLKTALEIFTDDNNAIETSIRTFMENSSVKGESTALKLEKMKNDSVLRAKMSLISKHNISCDNVLGDGDKGYPAEVDTIKKYCFDNPWNNNVSVIENLKKIVLKYESETKPFYKQKDLKQYATYQYCSAIRAKLTNLQEQKFKGKIKGDEFWVKAFMKTNDISQACLETDKVIQNSKLSASMLDGRAPLPVTEKERYISFEKPNIFSKNNSSITISKKSVSQFGTSSFENSNLGQSSKQKSDTYTLSDDKNLPPRNYDRNPHNSLIGGAIEGGSSNIGASNLTNLSPRADVKNSADRREDDNEATNKAVEAYGRLDPAKQMDVIKNSNNSELLEELLREVMKSKNKETDEQKRIVSELEKKIAKLQEENRNASVARTSSKGNIDYSPLAGNITQPGSKTNSSNTRPQVSQWLPERPYVPANNRADEISLKGSVSSGAGSFASNAGRSPMGESGIDSQIINNKNGNFIQIPKKELEFYKSLNDLDVAKAGEEGDFIKIELVDCPPDVSRTQDDKCVLLKNNVFVPLSIYMKGIAEKNEKYLAKIKTEDKNTDEATDKKPEEAKRIRHDSLKGKL